MILDENLSLGDIYLNNHTIISIQYSSLTSEDRPDAVTFGNDFQRCWRPVFYGSGIYTNLFC